MQTPVPVVADHPPAQTAANVPNPPLDQTAANVPNPNPRRAQTVEGVLRPEVSHGANHGANHGADPEDHQGANPEVGPVVDPNHPVHWNSVSSSLPNDEKK